MEVGALVGVIASSAGLLKILGECGLKLAGFVNGAKDVYKFLSTLLTDVGAFQKMVVEFSSNLDDPSVRVCETLPLWDLIGFFVSSWQRTAEQLSEHLTNAETTRLADIRVVGKMRRQQKFEQHRDEIERLKVRISDHKLEITMALSMVAFKIKHKDTNAGVLTSWDINNTLVPEMDEMHVLLQELNGRMTSDKQKTPDLHEMKLRLQQTERMISEQADAIGKLSG